MRKISFALILLSMSLISSATFWFPTMHERRVNFWEPERLVPGFATIINVGPYLSATTNSTANQTAGMNNALSAAAAVSGRSASNIVILQMPQNYTVKTLSVSPASFITLQGAVNFKWQLFSNGTTTGRLILIKNVQYVTVRDFEIDMEMAYGDLHDGWSPMEIAETANHILIDNMYIHHAPRNMSLPQNNATNTFGYCGIVIGGGHDIEIRFTRIEDTDTQIRAFESGSNPLYNLFIHHCVLKRGTSEGIGVGSTQHATSWATNITAQYNLIEGKSDSWGMIFEGVETFNASYNIVTNCYEGFSLSSKQNVGSFIYPETGQTIYNLPSKFGTIVGNKFYKNSNAGARISGQDILFEGNHLGSNGFAGINTERQPGQPVSNYTSTNLTIVNNTIDSIIGQFGSPMILKSVSNSTFANNLLLNNRADAQASFRHFEPYGNGNKIIYLVMDKAAHFETNSFPAANIWSNNRFPSYQSNTPGGAWTNSSNTLVAYSPPANIQLGRLLYYNGTGVAQTYNFTGNWRNLFGALFTSNTVLQPGTGTILYKSSTQPAEPPPPPPVVPKVKRGGKVKVIQR